MAAIFPELVGALRAQGWRGGSGARLAYEIGAVDGFVVSMRGRPVRFCPCLGLSNGGQYAVKVKGLV